ncbi:hypothetical protein R5R35_012030 [Gryllus longicercus]|uniref:Uncharacterized protein n=1 Tax=Gryllus longicercus TaxID=2509291 RepID=A0AAN9VE57_9ORTH
MCPEGCISCAIAPRHCHADVPLHVYSPLVGEGFEWQHARTAPQLAVPPPPSPPPVTEEGDNSGTERRPVAIVRPQPPPSPSSEDGNGPPQRQHRRRLRGPLARRPHSVATPAAITTYGGRQQRAPSEAAPLAIRTFSPTPALRATPAAPSSTCRRITTAGIEKMF